MRILCLNHNLREHGTWFRAFHLARELARLGHEMSVWTAAPNHWYRVAKSVEEGVRVVETPSWNPLIGRDDGWGPLDVLYRSAAILRAPFDLVYAFAHPPTVYLPARLARVVRRKPVVVDWCDVYRDGIFPLRERIRAYRGEGGLPLAAQRLAERVERRLERRIVRLADGVTVISRELERAAWGEGVEGRNVLRLPSGATPDTIRPLDKTQCRRALGIEGDGPVLGYVANYNPDERFLLASLSRALQRHPRARLLSAAPPFTESVVREAGVRGALIELGRRPFSEIATVLGAADVLLLPLEDNASNRGRWPNKFGDYLAAARPIAANAVGDVAEYFAPADSPDAIGVAAPPDPPAFAEAISALLDQPARWPAIGAAARRLAETRLNWQSLARTAEAFLNRYV